MRRSTPLNTHFKLVFSSSATHIYEAGYIRFWFSRHKFRMFRKRLHREAHAVEEALAHGVAKIKKELERGDVRQKTPQDLRELKKEVDAELKDLDKKI